jgi:hypothetical protein
VFFSFASPLYQCFLLLINFKDLNLAAAAQINTPSLNLISLPNHSSNQLFNPLKSLTIIINERLLDGKRLYESYLLRSSKSFITFQQDPTVTPPKTPPLAFATAKRRGLPHSSLACEGEKRLSRVAEWTTGRILSLK